MSNQDAIDVFDQASQKTNVDLSELIEKVNEAANVERGIKELEEMIKQQKSHLHKLRSVELPDAFAEVGMSEFVSEDGTKVKIDDFVSGSLPKDPLKREQAITHLEDIGGEGLIKDTMTVLFEKSQHNSALSVVSDLKEKGFNVDFSSGVHAQSLMAFAREKLKEGTHIETETLGLFTGRIAKIKLPKEN